MIFPISKRALVLIAVASVFGAGTVVWLRSTPPVPPEVPTAAEMPNQDEAAALADSHGLVWRDGSALSLRLKNGEILTLTDHASCGDLPCPKELSTHYRYLGWDAAAGGYRLKVTPSTIDQMLLPFVEEDPVLIDARRAAANGTPLAMPPPPPPTDADDSLNEWLADVARGRAQSEAPIILTTGGKVQRDGERLILGLANGRHVILNDDLACGQVACPPQLFRSFDFAGANPDGRFWVVEQRWDEASAAMLIDVRTGQVTELLGPPKFSPDGLRAAATVTDLEWSAPRRLEIWTLTGAAPGLEFSLSARDEDDTVYEPIGWVDANHLRLRKGPWASDQRTEVMLAHDAAGWHLEGSDIGN